MPLRIEILFAFCIMEPTSAKRREEGIIIMEREHHPLIVHDGRKKRIVRPVAAKIYVPIALRRKEGACRDLAVLFMDICRSLGLAARFVSGYKYSPDTPDQHELHAWAEVYLPGAGWRGYDPSWGLAVADHHVALAAGPAPQDAMPVTGTFRGTDVLSSLDYSVEIEDRELVKR